MRTLFIATAILFAACSDNMNSKADVNNEILETNNDTISGEGNSSITIILVDSVYFGDIKKPINNPFYTIEGSLGKYTYHEALKACKELGPGWQLPTVENLVQAYETFDTCDVWFETRDTNRGFARSTYQGMRKILTRDTSARIDVKPVKPLK